MKKPIKFVLLQTKDETLFVVKNNKKQTLLVIPRDKKHRSNLLMGLNYVNKHLYATVSQDVESIRAPCWVLTKNNPKPFKVNDREGEVKETFLGSRKIIATTDQSLMQTGFHTPLPQIQKSIVEEFCNTPNGNWEVEYETFQDNPNRFKFEASSKPNFEYWVTPKLKLNQDNTVNINSVDVNITLSRQKLKNILHCATGNVRDFVMHEDSFIDNWIKENL